MGLIFRFQLSFLLNIRLSKLVVGRGSLLTRQRASEWYVAKVPLTQFREMVLDVKASSNCRPNTCQLISSHCNKVANRYLAHLRQLLASLAVKIHGSWGPLYDE